MKGRASVWRGSPERGQEQGAEPGGEATGDIILFSDADIELDRAALRAIVAPCRRPRGRLRHRENRLHRGGPDGTSRGEGLYWTYEVFLRQKESVLGNLAMGSGLLAIRSDLFEPLDADVGDDFVLPIRTVLNGGRVVYEPAAVGSTVLYQSRSRDMFRTRVRIISKDLRGLFSCKAIMNPFKHPLHAWGLVSHKLLRWLVPIFLVGILLSLGLCALPSTATRPSPIVFYYLAGMNLLLEAKGKDIRLLCAVSSFFLVNSAAFVGVARFAAGKKSGRWQPIR
jgi:cellulose synthase/poly-beta-1,6-N-acetylglucosamine synthase-like glycosyltransferase